MPVPTKVKKLEDPKTLRALAHPLRLRLLGLLRTGGPATVSTLAGAVDHAIPLVSYHLRQLAEHGFIEEAPDLAKDRRETWWRSSHEFTSWSMTDFLDTPERLDALGLLQHEILGAHVGRIKAFFDAAQTWDKEWLDAAEMSDLRLTLTPAELKQLVAELWEVINRWRDREPSPDAGVAELILYGIPREPGPR
ncbi:MAG: helix-turn-helix domain-containing protein [Actinomycetota bacterium]